MNLPSHVYQQARQEHLIARDKFAIIRIETANGQLADNYKYEINDRCYVEAIAPCLNGEWEEFDRFFRIKDRKQRQLSDTGQPVEQSVVYSCAEHQSDPKLPDITVLPNLGTEERSGLARPLWVFGSTMGHYFPTTDAADTQQVLEFQTYGLAVLDREDQKVEVWVAQEGDKISVPHGCHLTLYNLGDENNPLITLSFSDPRTRTNQKVVHKCGPILLGYYDDFEVVLTLNRLYVNNPAHSAGVHLPGEFVGDRQLRQVRVSRAARLDLGRLLHEQLTHNAEIIGRFARMGLSVKPASREAVLEPYPRDRNSRLYFSSPLAEITSKGTDVYRFFIQDCESAKPEPPLSESLRGGTSQTQNETISEDRAALVTSLGRPFVIVVEGVGDWVENTYRPLFRNKARSKPLSVFYADDTTWKAPPTWAKNGDLESWEVYLDKSKSEDFARYENLRPDAVFVVTPDFTHSMIAREWLNKTAMVFVEKPFDSQVRNVEHLRLHMEQWTRTRILGLDHYQFYALPLHDMLELILHHLGGALANLSFYLTERRALERDRVKSLQYGLTLDLLPHLAAMLTYFGDISTVDEIVVEEAGQYDRLIMSHPDGSDEELIEGLYTSETYSRVHFTFLDRSGNNFRVPCSAVVGKGFDRDVKYLEITGINGNAMRVDLMMPDPKIPDYPWDSVFLIENQSAPRSEVRKVRDPYGPSRTLNILSSGTKDESSIRRLNRERYYLLIDDLLNGTTEAVIGTLSLTRGQEIVRMLDRIWWAIHSAKSRWVKYPRHEQSPFVPVGFHPSRAPAVPLELQRQASAPATAKNLVLPTRSSGLVTSSREALDEVPASVITRGPLPRGDLPRGKLLLSDLVTLRRKQVDTLPLTILIHGWGVGHSGDFLSLLRPSLRKRDALWVVRANPLSEESFNSDEGHYVSPAREGAVYLDLSQELDRRIYSNLVADLIYFPATKQQDSQQISSFEKRAAAIIIDLRNSSYMDAVKACQNAMLPVYLWSGEPSIQEAKLATATESIVSGGEVLSQIQLDEIGKTLKEAAEHMGEKHTRRIEFRKLILDVIEKYPGRPTWSADLVRQAHRHRWPIWAVECLPAWYVVLQSLEDGGAWALVSNYVLGCLPEKSPVDLRSELCDGQFYEVLLPVQTVRLLEPIARFFEGQLSTFPYPSERSFVGAINNALQEVELLLRKVDEAAADKALRFREAILKREKVIPDS